MFITIKLDINSLVDVFITYNQIKDNILTTKGTYNNRKRLLGLYMNYDNC